METFTNTTACLLCLHQNKSLAVPRHPYPEQFNPIQQWDKIQFLYPIQFHYTLALVDSVDESHSGLTSVTLVLEVPREEGFRGGV